MVKSLDAFNSIGNSDRYLSVCAQQYIMFHIWIIGIIGIKSTLCSFNVDHKKIFIKKCVSVLQFE